MTDPRIRNIVSRVLTQLPLGTANTWQPVAEHMMELVAMAGDGDHLEIGVLHGATAIMAALTKEVLGIRGYVYAVDPLSGWFPASPDKPDGIVTESGDLLTSPVEKTTGVPVSAKIFRSNVKFFGIGHRICLVQEFSNPWPVELEDMTFRSAYIDGDHYFDAPLKDWNNVHPRISPGGLVWFDDCNDHCPGVQKACAVASKTPGWFVVELFNKQTFVLQKEGK